MSVETQDILKEGDETDEDNVGKRASGTRSVATSSTTDFSSQTNNQPKRRKDPPSLALLELGKKKKREFLKTYHSLTCSLSIHSLTCSFRTSSFNQCLT